MPNIPFLKNKRVAGLIIAHRKKDSIDESHSVDDEDAGLHAVSADLIRAIHDKDVSAVSKALESAFQILDSRPHVEGEHLGEE